MLLVAVPLSPFFLPSAPMVVGLRRVSDHGLLALDGTASLVGEQKDDACYQLQEKGDDGEPEGVVDGRVVVVVLIARFVELGTEENHRNQPTDA